MLATLSNQRLGVAALAILTVGFMGLAIPILFHWNLWILAFVYVRKFIAIPLALSVLGLWFDRPKYAALTGVFLTAALYVSPKFIELAEVNSLGKSVRTIVSFIDQSGAELEHITLTVDGLPVKLPKNKYWSKVARFAVRPITDTPELDLTVDVRFIEGDAITGHELPTRGNGKKLERMLVFIKPDRTLEAIPFY